MSGAGFGLGLVIWSPGCMGLLYIIARLRTRYLKESASGHSLNSIGIVGYEKFGSTCIARQIKVEVRGVLR